jgi:type IV pilus assembly protein PilX
MANIQLCKLKQKQKQNGVILLVTLLALVIIMLSSLALVRSTDTNMILAGNYAFKRDVVNQAERAVPGLERYLQQARFN